MKEATQESICAAIVFVDSVGKPHDALITNVFGPQCVNVAFVNSDAKQTDDFGQKIARTTSVMHGNVQQAHGMYWLWPGEERIITGNA